MARIAGVDLPRDKRVEAGLTYIYGIGPNISKKILADTEINPEDRKSTRLNSSHPTTSRMPSSA